MNYYQILQVSKNASADEIKTAYRRLALECHPDRNNGDKELEDRFKLISCAYGYLSNPLKKHEYDQNLNVGGNGSLINIEEIMRKFREDIQLPLWLKLGINENVIKQAEMNLKNGWQSCSDLFEDAKIESSISSNNFAFFRLNFEKNLSSKIALRAISSKPEYFKIVLFDNNAQVIGLCKPTVYETHLEAVHIPWKHVVFCNFNTDLVPDKHSIQDSFELHSGMIICVYCEDWITSVNFKLSLKRMNDKMINELQKIDKFLVQEDLEELEKVSTKKSGQKTDKTKANFNLDKKWEECKNSLECVTYNGSNLTFEENFDGKLKLYYLFEEEKEKTITEGIWSCIWGSSQAKKRKTELQKVDILADKLNGIPKMVLNPKIFLQGNLELNEAHYFLMNIKEAAVQFESIDGQDFKIWVYNQTGQLIHSERARFSKLRRHITTINYPTNICDSSNTLVTVCLTNVGHMPLCYTLYTTNICQIIPDSSHYHSLSSRPILSTKASKISEYIKRRTEIYAAIVPL